MADNIVGVAMLALLHSGGITAWHHWRVIYPEIEALIWAAFIASYLIAKPLEGLGLARGLYFIGQISFSLYLLHYGNQRGFWFTIFPTYLQGAIGGIPGILLATLVIAGVAVALSVLTFLLIESPFNEMRGSEEETVRRRSRTFTLRDGFLRLLGPREMDNARKDGQGAQT